MLGFLPVRRKITRPIRAFVTPRKIFFDGACWCKNLPGFPGISPYPFVFFLYCSHPPVPLPSGNGEIFVSFWLNRAAPFAFRRPACYTESQDRFPQKGSRHAHQTRPDPGEHSPGPAGVCPPPDPGQPPAATVQFGRHLGGGPVHRGGGPGCGGVLLHPDDLSHLHPSGAVHGQQRLLLHPIWPAGPGQAAQRHLPGLSPHWRHHPGAQRPGLRPGGLHPPPAADSPGGHRPHQDLPAVGLCRDCGHLSL